MENPILIQDLNDAAELQFATRDRAAHSRAKINEVLDLAAESGPLGDQLVGTVSSWIARYLGARRVHERVVWAFGR